MNNPSELVRSIKEIVEQALRAGHLTPNMEAELTRLCQNSTGLTDDDCQSLDELVGALITDQVEAISYKKFINVTEDLVLLEASRQLDAQGLDKEYQLDIGDVCAYTLNRLPALYATTTEGAHYQRQFAEQTLQDLITIKVREAIQNLKQRPDFHPERELLGQNTSAGILGQVTQLLQVYATDLEPSS